MPLPFTVEQFFDVFAAYNESLWPFVVALWLTTTLAVFLFLRHRHTEQRFITALLVLHWAWAALAYHAAFFSKINPAAWLFSALFLIQAGLLAWYGLIRPRLQFSYANSIRHSFSWGLVAYALVYPGLVWAGGHAFPRLPTFGVPCPTTILTIGFLLAAKPSLPAVVTFIPILWALIGGSAAFLLGVHADLVLLAAGIPLLVYIIRVKCF